MPQTSWYARSVTTTAVSVLVWGLRLLYKTLRPVYLQQQYAQSAWHGGTPVVLAFWHGRMLYFLPHYHRQRFTMLVSQSKDGEFVSRVLQRFGVDVTRGSSSRGGTQALRMLVRKLRSGYHAALTPDGPRGPRYGVQPGVVAVAKQTGAAIVPVTYSAQWQTTLRSWDAFMIPWPFSRVAVVYGPPIYVPASATPALVQAKRQEVETSLRTITALADRVWIPPATDD